MIFVVLFCFIIAFLAGAKIITHLRSTRITDGQRENGVKVKRRLKHIEGLPTTSNSTCDVMVSDKGMIFQGGGHEFLISNSQITAVEVKTDVEIQNITDSSLTQGVVGGLVFGPIGAIIGARAKNKKNKRYEHYLIVNYLNSSGEVAAIALSSGENPLAARKIKDATNKLVGKSPRSSIQL